MSLINPAKKGELIDCIASVILRSIGKEGVVSTRKVNMAKMPTAENSATWNRRVRYLRLGGDETSAFAACCTESLIFSTGFSLACSGTLLLSLLNGRLVQTDFFFNRIN